MARLASQFVALPLERRALAFTQTAARMAVSSVMVEKDFWVSWLLGLLFADPALAPHLVFKGGTSLSKVYGVIDRFSEDIDLSMSPTLVGADEPVFAALKSRTRRDAALAKMQAQCGEQTRNVLMPRIEQTIAEHLGRRAGGASWLRYEDDAAARSPVVHFEYPTASEAGFEYLHRDVKLELGSLTDQRPTEQHAVRPWVVDDFPAAFPDWQCQVTALELARTFWRRRPSCTLSTIVRRTRPHPTAMRGTMPTWSGCFAIPTPPQCSQTMRCARVSSNGRAACLRASGLATTQPSQARFDCCLSTNGFLPWRATTHRCEPCSLRRRLNSRS